MTKKNRGVIALEVVILLGVIGIGLFTAGVWYEGIQMAGIKQTMRNVQLDADGRTPSEAALQTRAVQQPAPVIVQQPPSSNSWAITGFLCLGAVGVGMFGKDWWEKHQQKKLAGNAPSKPVLPANKTNP
jgi:hypothetical protein